VRTVDCGLRIADLIVDWKELRIEDFDAACPATCRSSVGD
jgi:hypothetical protein